jgi:hypothetical protein
MMKLEDGAVLNDVEVSYMLVEPNDPEKYVVMLGKDGYRVIKTINHKVELKPLKFPIDCRKIKETDEVLFFGNN